MKTLSFAKVSLVLILAGLGCRPCVAQVNAHAFNQGDRVLALPFGADVPQNASHMQRVAYGTLGADRPFVDCNEDQPKRFRNGDAPPKALATRLIQCLWEAPARPGMDGAQTVDIKSMDIGRPRKWVYQQDMGQGIADLDTKVWPLDVKWTWKTFYRSRTVVRVSEDIFNCYVNAFGKWSCGLGQKVRDISNDSIPVR